MTHDAETVERVANAIGLARWGKKDWPPHKTEALVWDAFYEQARAALSAMQKRLIPKEPDFGSTWVAGPDGFVELDEAQNAKPREVSVQEAAFLSLIDEGIKRGEKAMKKFPQPNYVISKFAEESGEVVKALIHHAEGRETREAVLDEMRDTLGMMWRLWVEGDQVHALRALSEKSHE